MANGIERIEEYVVGLPCRAFPVSVQRIVEPVEGAYGEAVEDPVRQRKRYSRAALWPEIPPTVGGVIAALYSGRWVDRVISVTGLSLAAMPEFVTGAV